MRSEAQAMGVPQAVIDKQWPEPTVPEDVALAALNAIAEQQIVQVEDVEDPDLVGAQTDNKDVWATLLDSTTPDIGSRPTA